MSNPDLKPDVEPRLFDLPSVLGHNDWSLSDAAELEARRLFIAAQLALFDAETSSGSAESAETRSAALITQAQLYRTAIAPHRKLPNEILTEIFFIASDEITMPSADLNSEPPWTFFRVCKRWRQIALAMPTLWTWVHLHYTFRGDEDRRWREMSKTVLTRSKGLAVSLRITGEGSRRYNVSLQTPCTPLAQAFHEFVVPNAHRLREFAIDASNRGLDEIFDTPSPQWDLLQHLALDCSRKNGAPRGVVRAFENAPHLTLNYSLKMFSIPAYHLPWTHITELNMPYSKLHPYAAHEILRQCQNIKTCSLSFSDNDYGSTHKPASSTNAPQKTSDPIILPLLTLLEVDIYKCSEFILFLKPLVLPQLTNLIVDGGTVMVPCPWNPEYIPVIATFGRLEGLANTFCSTRGCTIDIDTRLLDQRRVAP